MTSTTPGSAAFNNSQAANISERRGLHQSARPVQQHDPTPAIVKSEIVHSRVSLSSLDVAGSTPADSSKRTHLQHRPDAYACEVKVKDERLDEATIEQSYTDEEEATANEQKETDGNSAGGPVASAESSVQPQVSSQEVDAPVPVAPPVSRRPARRSQGRSVGGACVAHRTRARSGRPFAHRVAGVRATRSRVRAGEAYLVAGIE